MPDTLTELRDAAEFEHLLTESARRPVLIYKHSLSCGTSAEALDELLEHISRGGSDARYAMVTVQTHRELSSLIAKTLGVRHETPQALLVRNGAVVWSASHFRVTADALDTALTAPSPAPPPTPTTTPTGT